MKARLTPITELTGDELEKLISTCQGLSAVVGQLNAGLNARMRRTHSHVKAHQIAERQTNDLFWSTHRLGVTLNRMTQNMIASRSDRMVIGAEFRSAEELRSFVTNLTFAANECRDLSLELHPGICVDEVRVSAIATPQCIYH